MIPPVSERVYYWYCPNCDCEVDDSRVTFYELHDKEGCFKPVEIRELIDSGVIP